MMRTLPSSTRLVLVVLSLAFASTAQAGGRPGDFDYYALVLSWSPTYCVNKGNARGDTQCRGTRPFAFVLHGLWPQYDRGWPQFCRTAKRPWVPPHIIRSMLDIMPSRGLIIHEYKKHGTCAGLGVGSYFKAARLLYKKIVIPPRYRQPDRPISTSPREIENDFLRANPDLEPGMISIVCGGKRRLREIRICYSKAGKLRNCGRNENQRKLCRPGRLVLPPVRHSIGKKTKKPKISDL